MTTFADVMSTAPMLRHWPTEQADESRGMSQASQALETLLLFWASEPERYPVVRTGGREAIHGLVRLGVGRRDDHTCRVCHKDLWGQVYDLDHIVPWSAGGSDTSENLRVTCHPCNKRRSNWIDLARPALPVTWWCVQCWPGDGSHLLPIELPGCEPNVLAYCATCRHRSRTDVTV